MKTTTISAIIAGVTAGAITFWYTNPVKKLRVKNLTAKVRPAKKVENSDSNDHLFV